MFADNPPGRHAPETYAALKNSQHDADHGRTSTTCSATARSSSRGARATPPGTQVLYVKLAKTGGVVLSGDLYHYPQERTMNRLPTFEFNEEQTRAARASVEEFLQRTNAQLWIQHDLVAHAKLKKAPEYYD